MTRHPVTRILAALAVPLLVAACSSGGAAVPTIPPATPAPPIESSAPTHPGADVSGRAVRPPSRRRFGADDVRTVTIETPKGVIVIEVKGSLCPRSPPGTSWRSSRAATTTEWCSTARPRCRTGRRSSSRAATGNSGEVPTSIPISSVAAGRPYTIQDETVTATYQRGTVAMARTSEPNSANSQFFIVLSDAARDVLAAYNTYQIIGNVTSGMDVADAIYGAADAEVPTNPIPMTKVTVGTP